MLLVRRAAVSCVFAVGVVGSVATDSIGPSAVECCDVLFDSEPVTLRFSLDDNVPAARFAVVVEHDAGEQVGFVGATASVLLSGDDGAPVFVSWTEPDGALSTSEPHPFGETITLTKDGDGDLVLQRDAAPGAVTVDVVITGQASVFSGEPAPTVTLRVEPVPQG